MLYKVIIRQYFNSIIRSEGKELEDEYHEVKFGFNKWEDAFEFARTAFEVADGVEEGKCEIVIFRDTEE